MAKHSWLQKLLAPEVYKHSRRQRLMVQAGFSTPVKEAVLRNIQTGLYLHDPGTAYISIKKEDALLVKWMLETGYISEERMLAAVHIGICSFGREMYAQHCDSPRTHLDHLLSVKALGYAIKHGVVTPEEAAQIRFESGMTADMYFADSEGLLGNVMQELRNGASDFGIGDFPSR